MHTPDKAVFQGEVDAGAVACGPVAGLITDVPIVRQIIDRIVKQGENIVRQLNQAP
jgi:NAD(P)H-dependent flavin oxidoreductase YrpB (nitropropane dioxygenase family)